ncbi:MAG TPA: 3-hydroxyacyl-CoA dehydrogenase NAD-binding domain-containing protein, partial [Desulfatiglandales bacterium]|nr:3-hydroxyacyl-CoA dehydrogenase NAD-binding domain-containing protein [Desulfatiglandales bacterium]
VVMMDIKPEFVEKGLNAIRETLKEAVERRIIKPEKAEEVMGRIRGTTDLSEVRDCDLVIEAVFEDMAVKKELFERLDRICEPGTIIASNTSSFSVDDMAKAFNHPERFLGLHFFYHPAKNRLVEVIPGSKTSKQTIELSRLYAQLTGKTDILVRDSAGFAVNRIFVPWINEATRILEEGIANIPTIEKAGKESLGLGMGPFELMNITAVKTAFHAAVGLADKLGAFYLPSDRLKEQVQSGKPWPMEGEVDEAKLQAVAERLLAVAFFTASSLVQEGVSNPADTDLGAKVGLRWPVGPFEKMNSIGIDKAHDMVEELLKRWPKVRMPKNLSRQNRKGKPWDIRYVIYSRDGEVGRVLISRPDAMNALNGKVVRQLGEEFKKAERDPATRIIIIETAGKAFVAGADIKFFVDCIRENRLDDNYAFTEAGQKVLNLIDNSKKLVVAKMGGLALGGGFELALATDVIAATPRAVMGFPETGIGIYPGLGGTQRTSRFIGKELAKYLIFTGRIIPAQDALNIGIVDYVFPDEQIDEMIISFAKEGRLVPDKGKDTDKLPPEWQKIKALFADRNMDAWLSSKYLNSNDPLEAKTARIIAEKAPIALRLANRIIDVGYKKSLKAGMKDELKHLHEIFSTKDALTGLSNVGKKVQFEGK